ncbi:UbiA prenyltransferase family protein [Nocardia tengchongensis]|uniref:UbiA prenyltransferase family protein n=1 Tax=Nocardia tengchongensis TaxID=2055889 RepID=UPI0036C4090F
MAIDSTTSGHHWNTKPYRIVNLARTLRLCFVESRPFVQFMFALRFVAASALAAPPFASIPSTAWIDYAVALAAWFLTTVCVYLMNGIADGENDRINGVGRPISRGALDPRDAATVVQLTAVVALLLGLHIGISMAALVLAFLTLGYLYSMPPTQLSRSWFGSSAIVTLGGLCTYLAGGVAIRAQLTPDPVVFAVAMSLWMGLVGAVVKDFSDVAGDRAAQRRVLTLLVGEMPLRKSVAAATCGVATGLAVGASHLPSLQCACIPMLFGAAIVVGYTLTTRYRDPRPVSRRPYRAFMITQMAANVGALISGVPV